MQSGELRFSVCKNQKRRLCVCQREGPFSGPFSGYFSGSISGIHFRGPFSGSIFGSNVRGPMSGVYVRGPMSGVRGRMSRVQCPGSDFLFVLFSGVHLFVPFSGVQFIFSRVHYKFPVSTEIFLLPGPYCFLLVRSIIRHPHTSLGFQ